MYVYTGISKAYITCSDDKETFHFLYYLAIIVVVVFPALITANIPPRRTNKQCVTSTIEHRWYPQSVPIEGLGNKEDFFPPDS